MPKPKLSMVVNQRIPLNMHVDGVAHLTIYEDGAIYLMGEKVGSDPALAAALLSLSVTTFLPPPHPFAKNPAARKSSTKKPTKPASSTSSPVD